jgi:pimeloyl-ACP methyl ester carboxylesterase
MPACIAESVTLTAGSVTLSARATAPAGDPRATVLALPGGGYRAWYWDHPLDPGASLLSLGAMLGFRVIAVDRPGYGASADITADQQTVAAQAALLNELAARVCDAGDSGAGLFLAGHSLGAIVALEMATRAPSYPLLGVAVSGVPIRYPDYMIAGMAGRPTDGTHPPDTTVEALAMTFYGPEGTFDPKVLDLDIEQHAPVPVPEFLDARDYPRSFPVVAPSVRAPVQYVIAQHEASSVGGPETLREAVGRLSGSRRVDAWEQAAAGHNISLHRVARSYHLRVLAFFEECLATR